MENIAARGYPKGSMPAPHTLRSSPTTTTALRKAQRRDVTSGLQDLRVCKTYERQRSLESIDTHKRTSNRNCSPHTHSPGVAMHTCRAETIEARHESRGSISGTPHPSHQPPESAANNSASVRTVHKHDLRGPTTPPTRNRRVVSKHRDLWARQSVETPHVYSPGVVKPPACTEIIEARGRGASQEARCHGILHLPDRRDPYRCMVKTDTQNGRDRLTSDDKASSRAGHTRGAMKRKNNLGHYAS